MLLIDRIVGDRNDPDLHHKLHEYEHRGIAVDTVRVAPSDLDRRRLRVRTEQGEDLAIALSRQERLFDGAILYLTDDKAIVLRAQEQRWLRIVPNTKGDAVERLAGAGALVVFAGDAANDAEAVAAVNARGGLTVGVGPVEAKGRNFPQSQRT